MIWVPNSTEEDPNDLCFVEYTGQLIPFPHAHDGNQVQVLQLLLLSFNYTSPVPALVLSAFFRGGNLGRAEEGQGGLVQPRADTSSIPLQEHINGSCFRAGLVGAKPRATQVRIA